MAGPTPAEIRRTLAIASLRMRLFAWSEMRNPAWRRNSLDLV